jgi:hypothetical protein
MPPNHFGKVCPIYTSTVLSNFNVPLASKCLNFQEYAGYAFPNILIIYKFRDAPVMPGLDRSPRQSIAYSIHPYRPQDNLHYVIVHIHPGHLPLQQQNLRFGQEGFSNTYLDEA